MKNNMPPSQCPIGRFLIGGNKTMAQLSPQSPPNFVRKRSPLIHGNGFRTILAPFISKHQAIVQSDIAKSPTIKGTFNGGIKRQKRLFDVKNTFIQWSAITF